jgi:hypothetical protein
MQHSKAMVERDLYNNSKISTFPFDFVRESMHTANLERILRNFEFEEQSEPLSNFVTAINSVLVWTGARTASLPAWNYCDEDSISDFIKYLNKTSSEVPAHNGPVPEVIILHRPQVYRSGDGIEQGLVTRLNNPRVRFTTDPPVGDDEIGRELDMYPPNADNFAWASDCTHTAFSIWEIGSEALLYAEAWCEDLLSPTQLEEFLASCEKRIRMWNAAMEKLGLSYRFYGTMDWNRSELCYHKAEMTKRLFGREFIGADKRGEGYRGVSPKVQSIQPRAFIRSVTAAA